MTTAAVTHLISTEHAGRRFGGAYQVSGPEVLVWSRLGRLSARHLGKPAAIAREALDLIVCLHLSAELAGGAFQAPS